MNVYRIYPVLWNDGICKQAQTVYASDRCPNTFKTACSSRPKEDPAYYWDSPTFQRLLPPPNIGGCHQFNSVTWFNLPEWLSYVQTIGYTINVNFSSLKPYNDIYITGP